MREYKVKKCKRVHSVHFAPDGRRLLAVGGVEAGLVDAAVWLDLASGENVGRVERFATRVAVDPALTRYAIGGADARGGRIPAIEWTALGGPVAWHQFEWPERTLPPTYKNVSGLAFDPTGAWLAVGHARSVGARGELKRFVWKLSVVDGDTGAVGAELPAPHEACVMNFSPDGTRLAATGGFGGDPRVTVFDTAVPRALFTFAPPATVTRCALFLPDHRLVVASGRCVYVLGPGGGEPLLALEGHPKQVNAVAVAPGGRRLLTASHDGSVRTWDADTGAAGAAFDWDIGPVTALAFAPDGLTCAAAGLNGKVVVWDADG